MLLQQLAQQAQQAALDPMSPDILPAQFTASTIIVWLIDMLKRSDWFPWLSKETENLNRLAAIIGAAVTAAGIHFALEPAAEGTFTLMITGLSVMSVVHFLRGFAISIASQQTILKIYQITNVLREIAGKQ